MFAYYVEGLFLSKQSLKKRKRSGKSTPDAVEPFAKSIWAANPEEAIKLATDELVGGEWVEEPKVSQVSETQRMRGQGAPELPGFGL